MRIALQDWVAGATLSVPAGVSELLPLTNAQDPRLGQSARLDQGGESSLSITATFAQDRPVWNVSLLAHTVPSASVTIEYLDASDSVLATDNPTVWQRPHSYMPWHLHHLRDAAITCRKLRVSFDAASAGESVVELGRLWASDAWHPDKGMHWDWPLTVVDPSAISRSSGQQAYAARRARYRQVEARFTVLPESNVYAPSAGELVLQDVDWIAGLSEQVIVFPRTGPADTLHRTAVYGLIRRSEAIGPQRGGKFERRLTVEETL